MQNKTEEATIKLQKTKDRLVNALRRLEKGVQSIDTQSLIEKRVRLEVIEELDKQIANLENILNKEES